MSRPARPRPAAFNVPCGLLAYAAALACTAGCTVLVFDDPRMIGLALNSDSLLPFSFAWDLAHMPGAWRGHELARIPSLLPDLAVLGAALAATGAAPPALLLYGVLQALGLVHVGGLLAARLCGGARGGGFAGGCALLSAGFAALVALERATGTGIVLNAFLPIDHVGPFLAVPLAGALADAQLRRATPGRALCLAVCCSLVFLSDLMLLVELVLPLLCACAVLVLARIAASGRVAGVAAPGRVAGIAAPGRVAGIVAAAAAGTLAGWLGLRALRLSGLRFEAAPPLSPALARASVRGFLAHAPVFAAAHPGALAAGLLVPLAAFAAFPALALAQARRAEPAADPARPWQDLFLWCFAAAGLCGSLAFAALLYVDEGSYRYLVALWAWPLVFLAATVLRAGRPAVSAAPAVLAAALLAARVGQAGWPPGVLRWDQDVAACLRPLREGLGLHAGLAGYWDARPIEVATHWSLQVDQIAADGHAYLWGNDRRWYRHALGDPARPPAYDFIVMRGLPADRILAAYGPPDIVVPCAPTEVWVYRDAAALTAALIAGSPGL